MAERAREGEEAAADAARVASEAAAAASRSDKAALEFRRRCEAAEKAGAERDADLGKARAIVADLTAQVLLPVCTARPGGGGAGRLREGGRCCNPSLPCLRAGLLLLC